MTHNNNLTPNGEQTTGPGGVDAPLNTGAYVLNALTPAERDEFEIQLAGSETLRNEVTELRDTAVLLGMAVAPVQPSPELKTNLMAMLASTPQLSKDIAPVRTLKTSMDAAPAESTVAPVLSDAAPVTSSAVQGNAKSRARWFNRPIVALTSIAAAVALVIGAGAITTSFSQNQNLNDAATAQADQLAAITAADDMQRVVASVSTGGTATLVWSGDLGKSALMVDGLPALPDDQTYELWYIDEAGVPTAAGLLDVSEDSEWLVLEGDMAAGDTVGVTVEPSGGSEQPTSTPIVAIASA